MSSLNIFSTTAQKDMITEIREHLVQLFNARRGSLQHLPYYGLPDLNEIYQGLPYSLRSVQTAIAETIERYEPRLYHINVTSKVNAEIDAVLTVEITGRLKSFQSVVFGTVFLSGGKVLITATNEY